MPPHSICITSAKSIAETTPAASPASARRANVTALGGVKSSGQNLVVSAKKHALSTNACNAREGWSAPSSSRASGWGRRARAVWDRRAPFRCWTETRCLTWRASSRGARFATYASRIPPYLETTCRLRTGWRHHYESNVVPFQDPAVRVADRVDARRAEPRVHEPRERLDDLVRTRVRRLGDEHMAVKS